MRMTEHTETSYPELDTPDVRRLAVQGDAAAMEDLARRYNTLHMHLDDALPRAVRFWADKRAAYWRRCALAAWRARAAEGDALACWRLGDMLHSMEWLHRAADAGNADACLTLHRYYAQGFCTRKDATQAAHWLRRTVALLRQRAEQGCLEACGTLAGLLCADDDPEERREERHWFEQWRACLHATAEGGDAESCLNLAGIFRLGMGGFPKDEQQADLWHGKACTILQGRAEAGDAAACLLLAHLADTKEDALQWRQRAAQLGHSGGMYQLGEMLRCGEGTRKNLKEGYAWLRRAAEAGSELALAQCTAAACASARSKRSEQVQAQAALENVALSGGAEACLLLGLALRDGCMNDSMNGNAASAQHWLEQAATSGLPEAALALAETALKEENGKKAARPLLQHAAEAGDADAQRQLALLLWEESGNEGKGQALHWMRQAAQAGDESAATALEQWALGCAPDEAEKQGIPAALHSAAYEGGNARALCALAHLAQHAGDTPRAAQLWSQVLERASNTEAGDEAIPALIALAQAGCATALHELREWGEARPELLAHTLFLGRLYAEGSPNVPADDDEAVRWLAKTCGNIDNVDPEHDEAIKLLTRMAEQGSQPAARTLYELEAAGSDTCTKRGGIPALLKAAKKGHPEAMFLAGELRRLGNIRTDYQDLDEAAQWHAKAAKKGHPGAQHALDALAPVAELFQRAESGDAEAHWRIGQMHETGSGQRQHLGIAIARYGEAAALGHVQAAARLRQLAEKDGHIEARWALRRIGEKGGEAEEAQ